MRGASTKRMRQTMQVVFAHDYVAGWCLHMVSLQGVEVGVANAHCRAAVAHAVDRLTRLLRRLSGRFCRLTRPLRRLSGRFCRLTRLLWRLSGRFCRLTLLRLVRSLTET